jgi:ferrochelatase
VTGPRVALLVNLGTPSAPTAAAVRAFLAEFLSDPLVVDWPAWLWQPLLQGVVLRRRPARIAEAYRQIWTAEGSPLAAQTRALARAVQVELGAGWDVRAAFRYGAPGLASELAALREAGRAVSVLPLFPQRTRSSGGSIEALVEAGGRDGGPARVVRLAPDDAGYIAALAEPLRAAPRSAHLLASFHSVPRRIDRAEVGRYLADCRTTFEALLATLDWPRERAELCFQSRFGPERWLGPATAERLAALPRAGTREVIVTTPGFLTEGLETVEEIGLRGEAVFRGAGGLHFTRVPCAAGGPLLARAIAAALRAGPPP